MLLTATCLFACKRDRDFAEGVYRSHQMSQDLEKNREGLYETSFVGVHKEIKDEKDE